jgi:tRNA uridine 5-carboxymethylaminomethyl modification enzyme
MAETLQKLRAERIEHVSLADWLKRPEFFWANLPETYRSVDPEAAQQVETEIKYAGYIGREMELIAKTRDLEDQPIPLWLDYDVVQGLKTEARNKLKSIQPRTFGQAGRISGINPSDISLLMVWSKRGPVAVSGKAGDLSCI